MRSFIAVPLCALIGFAVISCVNAQLQPQCPSEIFCHGILLHTIQMARINNDSKTFVDMKLKALPNITLANFHEWHAAHPEPNATEVRAFVDANFDPEGSEFESWIPDDYVENPEFFDYIYDPEYRNFAIALNKLWLILGRKITNDVALNPELYSIIYVENPVIIPGGRFREFYYWDSYWIILGLLASEMFTTTQGMLENFISVVERYGFIPNGGRVYYMGRSQPPLLIPMVHEYIRATGNYNFVRDNIDTLEKEFQYWFTNKTIELNGHTVAMYGDQTSGPRPESYAEDFEAGEFFNSAEETEAHYSELKAAAESGMDFSSRWFVDEEGGNNGSLFDLRTSSIVPVELNAILFGNAVILSNFYRLLGNETKANYYDEVARAFNDAVQELFWHEDVGAWLDWDLTFNQRRDHFVPTNLSPLWTNCYNRSDSVHISERVLSYLEREELDQFPGGIPNTLEHTGEQWDFPNVWPPMQHIVIIGLNNLGTQDAYYTALQWANRWVYTNYVGFERTGFMFEKYSAELIGVGGDGGEYDLQTGFGWSNGVILDLFRIFGQDLTKYPRSM